MLRDEVAALVGLLPDHYRLTLWLHLGGATQVEISAALGVGQPAVSHRLRQIRSWLATCAPVRARMRDVVMAPQDAAGAAVASAVIWLHQPLRRVAARTGWTQGALWQRWRDVRAQYDIDPLVGSCRWAVPG